MMLSSTQRQRQPSPQSTIKKPKLQKRQISGRSGYNFISNTHRRLGLVRRRNWNTLKNHSFSCTYVTLKFAVCLCILILILVSIFYLEINDSSSSSDIFTGNTWNWNVKNNDDDDVIVNAIIKENRTQNSNDQTIIRHSNKIITKDDDDTIQHDYALQSYYSNSFNSSNNNQTTQPKNKHHISYKVIRHLPFNNTFDIFYKCDQSKRKSTTQKFKLFNTFDFQIQMRTSYHILFMGDSVGIQLSQAFQEANGIKVDDERFVMRYSWRDHEGLHIAASRSKDRMMNGDGEVSGFASVSGRGGGAVAGWRITGLLQERQRNNDYQMPPTPGGGWMEVDWRNIKRALHFITTKNQNNDTDVSKPSTTNATKKIIIPSSPSPSTCAKSLQSLREITKIGMSLPPNTMYDELRGCPEKNFDVAIFQIPFSWFDKPAVNSMSYHGLNETINLLHTMFGAKIIIVMNVPVTNNLQDIESEMIPINNIVKNYTDTFTYTSSGHRGNSSESGEGGYNDDNSIQAVLLMDMASFSMELFKENAAALDLIDLSSSSASIQEQLNNQLQYRTECCHYAFPQIIGYTCAEVVQNMTKKCKRTRYSCDGQHWCMNEVGGRINGVMACLIKCGHDFPSMFEELKICEQQCNKKYMSLERVPIKKNGYIDNY
jgi:hypothetical protein